MVKGEWKGPIQVRIKAATRLYAQPDRNSKDRVGAPKRALSPGELLTVKAVHFPGAEYLPVFVVAEPEGDLYLIPDPAKMEWAAPAQ
jgi:hypothetical protein